MKNKAIKILTPVLKIFPWLFVLYICPDISISNEIFNKRLHLETSIQDCRNIDMIFISILSIYILMFLDWLIINIKYIKPIHINCYFENINTKDKKYSIVEKPEGSPVRVNFHIDAKCYRYLLYKLFLKITRQAPLIISWKEEWLQLEVDTIDDIPYEKEKGHIKLDILKCFSWPGGKLDLPLMIVTKNRIIREGYLNYEMATNLFITLFLVKYKRGEHLMKIKN